MGILEKYPLLKDEGFLSQYDFGESWTRVHPDKEYEELDVAVAIIIAEANPKEIAKLLQRPRSSVMNYISRNSELRRLMEDVWEEMLDDVEFGLLNTARRGDPSAQKFFLQTRGKNRGYITRSETTGKDGEPLVGNLSSAVIGQLSDQALQEIIDARDAEMRGISG